jgi:hypothetical protein
MRVPDLKLLVDNAVTPSPWDLGNGVLYRLCREHPTHEDCAAVIAKVWLIGRACAAAIERRRPANEANNSFYVDTVAPAIMKSDIDAWIGAVRERPQDGRGTAALLGAHARVTRLFESAAGLNKRSLASKYLHFHVPEVFYIYDTRAIEGLNALSERLGRSTSESRGVDVEYRRFVDKCLLLQCLIEGRLGVRLTPRQLDNLLLSVHAAAVRKRRAAVPLVRHPPPRPA